ncbi:MULTISPECIES: hypothetical protein [Providencia]|uniref:hypothetical protein n=1 Tax=Providencia TaxID=586 RepID=UPI00313C7426
MTDTTIKPMKIKDIPFIMGALITEAKNKHFASTILDVKEQYKMADQFKRCIYLSWIGFKRKIKIDVLKLVSTGEPIGFVWTIENRGIDTNTQTPLSEIFALYILDEFRNRKLSPLLINYVRNTLPGHYITARCLYSSDRMRDILLKNNFHLMGTDPNGTSKLFAEPLDTKMPHD